VESSPTLFYGPMYSDDNRTLSFLCVRNVSELTVEHSVTAVLTFDGVVTMSVSRSKLSSTTDDTVEFNYTAEDIRGQFGKWVGLLSCLLSFTSSCAFVFSKRELRYVCYMLSQIRLSVVCLSVTLVRPTQPVEIFGNFFHHTIAQGI